MFENTRDKLLALGLAIIFWVLIFGLESSFANVPEPIPVQVFNLGEKLALSMPPPNVSVTIRSETPDIIRQLRASDFEAFIDVGGFGVGEKKVTVSVNSKNPRVSVLRVDPPQLTVKLEPLGDRILPVTVQVTGLPASGFSVKETSAAPNFVHIYGAKSLLQNIEKAIANIELSGTEEADFRKNVTLTLSGFSTEPVTGVRQEFLEVEISVVLERRETEKTVPVKVNFTGALSGTSTISAVLPEPAVLTITGTKEALEKITALETEEINLDNREKEFSEKVAVKIPSGVSLKASEPRQIEVTVTILSSGANL